jgi:hypothetical protein
VAASDVHLPQKLSLPGARFFTAAVVVHEDSDLLVARTHEAEPLCKFTHPPARLGDGTRWIVETAE